MNFRNFAVKSMDRTFQHRFTPGAKCALILFSALALYFFWTKTIVPAVFLVLVVIALTERVLHSGYVLTRDELIIIRGRFLRRKTILLSTITSCRPMTNTFGWVHYLLLEYGDQRLIALEPVNEREFLKYLALGMRRTKIQENL